MAIRGSFAFRGTLICCACVAAAGLGLLLYGLTLPAYNVPYEEASAAFGQWCNFGSEAYDKIGAQYHAMFGWRYSLMNAGLSVLLGSITAAFLTIGLWLGRTRRRRDDWRSTPAHASTFIAIGIGTVSLLLAGIADGLDTDLRRQMFPPCADSIAIPLMGLAVAGIIMTPILAAIGWMITRSFGALPVSLWHWDGERLRRSWAVTIVCALLIAATIGVFLTGITSSDMISPAVVVIIYLLAATRAAMLAPDERCSA